MMLYIKKQHEPKQLTDDKRQGLKSYIELTHATKNIIKESLLNEQGYLCAYCMQRITMKDATIEHYIAQNSKELPIQSLRLQIGKMLLS